MTSVYHVFAVTKRKVNQTADIQGIMSMDYGAFDTALNAAAGDDPVLASELRMAFLDSAKRQLDLLGRSRCDANWQYSCYRLKGLAASFGVTEIVAIAEEGAVGAPGDPVVLRKIAAAITAIEATA